MNSYGYKTKLIDKLDDISCLISSGLFQFHFIYKNTDFYYSHKSNDYGTLVSFHAAVEPTISLPVFRGHDWSVDNTNILCVSDPVLAKYREGNNTTISFDSTFFQGTSKIDSESIIIEVLAFFQSFNVGDILTFGTSAGGLAALKYSSYFNGYCLIGNAEFHLDIWWNFENTAEVIRSQDDEIDYPDIFSWLNKYGPPKTLILSSNVFDDMTFEAHHLPIVDYFQDKHPEKLYDIRHCEKHSGKFHTSHFPANTPYKKLIETLSYDSSLIEVITDSKEKALIDFDYVSKFINVSELSNLAVSESIDAENLKSNHCKLLVIYNKVDVHELLKKIPVKIDWVFIRKANSNPTPSKHGVFTISLPFKKFFFQSNDFSIVKY